MAKCYKFAISKTSTCDIGPIHQAPDGLQNPRETKAFAIENWAGKWSIATVQMGNNFAHTVRDHLYLGRLEQIQRAHPAAEADRRIARLTMPDPEQAAAAERQKASDDAGQYAAIHRLALEALTVLYRLADYYPPEWLTGQPEGYTDPDGRPLRLEEGKYLARAARDLLLGWQALIPREGHPAYANWQAAVLPIYGEPLRWFETGIKHLADIEARRCGAGARIRPLIRPRSRAVS